MQNRVKANKQSKAWIYSGLCVFSSLNWAQRQVFKTIIVFFFLNLVQRCSFFITASDKPDLGLEELSSLNVKSRFQVFEKQEVGDSNLERSPTTVSVKRSSSILSKLAK